jgi:4-hydroxy-tetrahydrodipicolinate reductase
MTPLQLGLLGYGKMGRAVEACLREAEGLTREGGRPLVLAWTLDAGATASERLESLAQADVVIEFTQPEAAVGNILAALEAGVAVVCGTTGWYAQLDRVKAACAASDGALLYAPNFSIGVNLFFALQEYTTRLFARYPRYRLSLSETHHSAKLDAPSGTALHIAESVVQLHPGYSSWQLTDRPEAAEGMLPVTAHRMGSVPGTHSLCLNSPEDAIVLEHAAHNRSGFARGALEAAQWLPGRKGVFTMRDLLDLPV